MYCRVCEKDVHHRSEMGSEGIERHCVECDALLRDDPEDKPAPPQPQAQRKRKGATVARDASEPLNVVKEAKKRLRFVKREIKRLRAFEKEAAQLERLLAAAETPVAAVTPISRARNNK